MQSKQQKSRERRKTAEMSDLPVVKSTMNNLTQRSPYSQIGMGAAGGFLTGFVLLKASKMVAVAAGGTILAIELAMQAGLVRVDVLKIMSPSQDQDQPRGQLQVTGEGINLIRVQELGDKARKACATSGRLCVAFLGGFLLGFGWA
ncbi:FUN14 domain-containing protein 2 [Drosophila subpulchrella]|uniref:FUN14 domain-containing protein 2 n=1 Tax=Drosophila subpulchrella TaxID=1486046 RepID=UPI0018A18D6E|nr:FUN14 domain-containing protein 2 [Drosophila subpulchrella]